MNAPRTLTACIVCILLTSITCVMLAGTADFANADTAKMAIPSISKSVRTGSQPWDDAVCAEAGSTLRYRIRLTLPESAAQLETLSYTIIDKPAQAIAIEPTSVNARVTDTHGRLKKQLNPHTRVSGRTVSVSLGDMKTTYPDIKFGELIFIEYNAVLSAKTDAGEYPNIARLVYDDGTEKRDTVDVMANVTVPSRQVTASSLPKTGDARYDDVTVAAAAAALAVICASRRRTKGG